MFLGIIWKLKMETFTTLWFNSLRKIVGYKWLGLSHLHCFKDSKCNNIFLVCAHMARNPYFPVGRKICLMGDRKVRVYYSSWDNVYVSICTIRILVYVLYETLDLHYKKIVTFFFDKNTLKYGLIALTREA